MGIKKYDFIVFFVFILFLFPAHVRFFGRSTIEYKFFPALDIAALPYSYDYKEIAYKMFIPLSLIF